MDATLEQIIITIKAYTNKTFYHNKYGETLSGNDAFENDPAAKAEIEKLNEKIYARTDPQINRIYDDGRVESLAEFEKIYKRLGTKFDFNYFESKVGKRRMDNL